MSGHNLPRQMKKPLLNSPPNRSNSDMEAQVKLRDRGRLDVRDWSWDYNRYSQADMEAANLLVYFKETPSMFPETEESLKELAREGFRRLSKICHHQVKALAKHKAAENLAVSKHTDASKDCADTNILEHTLVEASYVCKECADEIAATINAEPNDSDYPAVRDASDGASYTKPRSNKPLEHPSFGAFDTDPAILQGTVHEWDANFLQASRYAPFEAADDHSDIDDQFTSQFRTSTFQPLHHTTPGASNAYLAISNQVDPQENISHFQSLEYTILGALDAQTLSGMSALNFQTLGFPLAVVSDAYQLIHQENASDLQISMARDLPDGREVFRGVQEIQGPVEYFIQYGSLPAIAINRHTGRATSTTDPANTAEREVSEVIVCKDAVSGVSVPEIIDADAAISEDNIPSDIIPEDTIPIVADSDDISRYLTPEDNVLEDAIPEAVVADDLSRSLVLDNITPEDTTLDIILQPIISEVVEQDVSHPISSEEVTSRITVLEDSIVATIVPDVNCGEDVSRFISSEATLATVVPDVFPDPSDATIQDVEPSVEKDSKRTRKSKLKKKRKIEAEPVVSQETKNDMLLLEIQRKFQGCAEKLKEPVREIQKCLEVFLLHLSGGNAQKFETNFLDCVKSAECDIEILSQHVRLATTVLFPPELEVDEPRFAATASWICSSPTPDSDSWIKRSQKSTVYPSPTLDSQTKPVKKISPTPESRTKPSEKTLFNTNPPPAEIKSSSVPFNEDFSILSNASQSQATPSVEHSFNLPSSESATTFEKKSFSNLEEEVQQEAVIRSWCSCQDGAERMVSEGRHPFSSFKQPPITRRNSLPIFDILGAKKDPIVVTTEEDSNPTKPPPSSTTHIPVTRKIVHLLLNQELPVYASWQVWYYPGPFSRGKGPRVKNIPMQLKVVSVGHYVDDKPTYLVPKLGKTFDSRYTVSLEDGTFLPVIPREDEHKNIMLSYKDYLNYDFLFSLNAKSEHRMYNFQHSVLDAYKAHIAQKSVTPSDRTVLLGLLSNVWEQMKAAGIQRLNENIKWSLQTQNKWKVKVEQCPWAFYKVSDAASKKWAKLRYELQKIDPMTVNQAQLFEIMRLFSQVESAVIAGMTKAFKDKDLESYYDVDMEVEFELRGSRQV